MPAFPLWWPSTDTDNGDGEPAPAAEEPSDTDLSTQIGNLAAEVQMLREEQAQAAQPAEPAPPPEPPPATVLVYRDGRQVEVVNFAILGQTLFVFSGQKTERVPLSDLDLTATERVNNDRGVEFNLPTEK